LVRQTLTHPPPLPGLGTSYVETTQESLPVFKSLAAYHIPKPFLGTPREEEIHPLEFPFEFKEDLSPDIGNTFNHLIQ
jgi:hypothetical protein